MLRGHGQGYPPVFEGAKEFFQLARTKVSSCCVLDFELLVFLVQFAAEETGVHSRDDEVF